MESIDEQEKQSIIRRLRELYELKFGTAFVSTHATRMAEMLRNFLIGFHSGLIERIDTEQEEKPGRRLWRG